jgi:predicted transposase
MPQVITAKLKLNLTTEQKGLVSQTARAYRDALNYTSQVAFDAGKTSNGAIRCRRLSTTNCECDLGLERKWLAMYPDKYLLPIRPFGLK